MTVFPILILAHLLGDFLFQPQSWVKAKEQRLFAIQAYPHAIIHGVLASSLLYIFSSPILDLDPLLGLLRLQPNQNNLSIGLLWTGIIVAITHFLIDIFKSFS